MREDKSLYFKSEEPTQEQKQFFKEISKFLKKVEKRDKKWKKDQ